MSTKPLKIKKLTVDTLKYAPENIKIYESLAADCLTNLSYYIDV
ncbi:MAG: hypothetical protein QNJ55_20540 [Xenococcus sp. MO_188.B8]|nr:hypothetical protein [Xenococcus sp. MO_188.B8]